MLKYLDITQSSTVTDSVLIFSPNHIESCLDSKVSVSHFTQESLKWRFMTLILGVSFTKTQLDNSLYANSPKQACPDGKHQTSGTVYIRYSQR